MLDVYCFLKEKPPCDDPDRMTTLIVATVIWSLTDISVSWYDPITDILVSAYALSNRLVSNYKAEKDAWGNSYLSPVMFTVSVHCLQFQCTVYIMDNKA